MITPDMSSVEVAALIAVALGPAPPALVTSWQCPHVDNPDVAPDCPRCSKPLTYRTTGIGSHSKGEVTLRGLGRNADLSLS